MSELVTVNFRKEYRINSKGECSGKGEFVAIITLENKIARLTYKTLEEMANSFTPDEILMTLYPLGEEKEFYYNAKDNGCIVGHRKIESSEMWLFSEDELNGIEDDDEILEDEESGAEIYYLGK